MIYVTEQQIVFTAGTVVIVGLVAMFLGRWWGVGQGREQGYEEREREEREEAKARRTHPAYQAGPVVYRPPDYAREAGEKWLAHEEQAVAIANDGPDRECPACHDTYVDLPGHLAANLKGCAPGETVLLPTAVLTPEDMSWTGEIQRMTADFERDMARIMGGTDEQLRGITR